jgi:putative oxidoreductase
MGAVDRTDRRLGQLLLSAVFVKSGLEVARQPGARVEKAAKLGFSDPERVVRANGAAMAVGGAALAFNKVPRLAALGLIASMVPTTVAGHPFWELEGADRKAQEIHFLKNVGLIGGLLLVLTRKAR